MFATLRSVPSLALLLLPLLLAGVVVLAGCSGGGSSGEGETGSSLIEEDPPGDTGDGGDPGGSGDGSDDGRDDDGSDGGAGDGPDGGGDGGSDSGDGDGDGDGDSGDGDGDGDGDGPDDGGGDEPGDGPPVDGPIDYDIVYVRQPRYGDEINTSWPEVFHPAKLDLGADLMLLHPDGTEEVLFEGGIGSVTDPFVTFDGESVLFSYFPDMRSESLNHQRKSLPRRGADIYRIHVPTRAVTRLTFGEFTPNTGAGRWDESNPVDPPRGYNALGYGILNLGPCPLPGGKIIFTSNRNGFEPPKVYTAPTMQLYVMDEDGTNVEAIAPMTIGSALHPTILRDGRVMFSSYESQGVRDRRIWGIWSIYPDGREWGPIVSAFKNPAAFHFMTQLGGAGDLVIENYYNLNNNGFGFYTRQPATPPPDEPPFYSAFLHENPEIQRTMTSGRVSPFRMAFTPKGMYAITPGTHGQDSAAPERGGKYTHPSAAPNHDLLTVWTGGPANDLPRPTQYPRYDAGLYLIPGGNPVWYEEDMVLIKNDPLYNEAWPRALVPYRAIHGVDEPAEIPWLPNDGTVHPLLPEGTPYGLVGTSSFMKRDTFPGEGSPDYQGLDRFNTTQQWESSNWFWQGADAGKYTNNQIWAVRVLAMEPNTHRSYGPHEGRQFHNHANERLRILGEIPLRKFDDEGEPILDPEGFIDTSFLAKITADTPFTFQTVDRFGMVLNMSQTWHQVRPGELRANCGGCHAHSQVALPFEGTAASLPDYPIYDLSKETPMLTRNAGEPALRVEERGVVDVEFYRDIRPVLQRSCVPCHTVNNPDPPARLVLDDYSTYDGFPGDYRALAIDPTGGYGYPPVIRNGKWQQTNASRFVRKFQSRRSLLIWKIHGRRLDGWTNEDHPTEAVPGDPDTLPPGADANSADLDYTGTMMPPPGSSVPPLTPDERMNFARWVDLGAPINSGQEVGSGDYGWFLDDLRPTLTISSPRSGVLVEPVTKLRIGIADINTGIDPSSLSVKATFDVRGRSAGSELADLFEEVNDGVLELDLGAPLTGLFRARLQVEVKDHQGNVTRMRRTFSTAGTQ